MKKDAKVQAWVDSFGKWVSEENKENCPGGTGRMTKELYPYTSLFSPITVNRTKIKNRLVMAPMGNIDMCEETGRPNDKMLQYFFQRAKGGVGLITTGLIPVTHGIDNSITELGKLTYFPRIDRSRTVFSGWRDLAQGCHSYGAKIFVQLTAGLGRVGNPQCLINELKFPVSASNNPNFYMSAVPCLRLSGHKIKKIIKNMGQATADAKAAGLDGVYIHGHEGYLIEQLTNPAFNRRKIGKYADWQRFGIDMVKEMRRRGGDAYPIMYRIDLSLALNETYGENMKNTSMKKFTAGRTIADTLNYMTNLVKAGVDMFDVDLGCYDNWWLPHPPSGMPAGCFLEVAQTVKEYFRQNKILSNAGVEVPVVAVGKLGYPDLAEQALRDGQADMIMLGRPLLADPDWCNKAFAGKVEDIRPCIGCQEGCLNEFVEGGHPQCAVNPRTAFEDVFPEIPQPAEHPKKIAVVGGGPGGVMAAITAAKRGHSVTLYEKSGIIGGKLVPGGAPKIKFDVENYRRYMEHALETAREENDLKVCMNTAADCDLLQSEGFDTVIFANGAGDIAPKFPGMDQVKSVQATHLLNHPEEIGSAKKAVVIGGGVVGCETAYWLKYEYGVDVTVVEMADYFMYGVCTANRGHLIHYLQSAGVQLLNGTKVVGFEKSKVKVQRNTHKNLPDPYNTWAPILPENIENPLAPKIGKVLVDETLDADLVVLAMGNRADDTMFYNGQTNRIAPEIYTIGDSYQAGKVHQATRSAYHLAVRL